MLAPSRAREGVLPTRTKKPVCSCFVLLIWVSGIGRVGGPFLVPSNNTTAHHHAA